MLNRDPFKRLGGSKLDALELFNHPFYEKVDWIKMVGKRVEVPFRPDVREDYDTKYIEQDFLDLTVN